MTAEAKAVPYPSPADEDRDGLPQWLLTTDHKRIGLLTIGTALVEFLFNGALALTMRAQLAQPSQDILSPQQYLQFMTAHGTGMIALTVTPLAIGLGVYLVPLQVGAPRIAAPRATLLGYWLYVFGAIALLWAFVTPTGGASDGWWGYTPLSSMAYSPGYGMSLWTAGVFLAACGMILMSAPGGRAGVRYLRRFYHHRVPDRAGGVGWPPAPAGTERAAPSRRGAAAHGRRGAGLDRARGRSVGGVRSGGTAAGRPPPCVLPAGAVMTGLGRAAGPVGKPCFEQRERRVVLG